jgi:hypothetical protein
MTNNTMVYTCNTLEVNVIPKTTQDWSVIKYERNKLNKCKFKRIVSYGKPNLFPKIEVISEKSTKFIYTLKEYCLELQSILDLLYKDCIDYSYYNAIRIKRIAGILNWNINKYDIPKGKNKYGQKVSVFDWNAFIDYVHQNLKLTMVISKYIGFRPMRTIEEIVKPKSIVTKVTDLYNIDTTYDYTPKAPTEHLQKLRRRMKMKSLQNRS